MRKLCDTRQSIWLPALLLWAFIFGLGLGHASPAGDTCKETPHVRNQ